MVGNLHEITISEGQYARRDVGVVVSKLLHSLGN